MNRKLVAATALVLLAGGSVWLLRLNEVPATRVPLVARHIPDFYVQDYIWTAFDDVGGRRYQMQGQRMTHYADDHMTQVDAPQVLTYRRGSPAWHLRAERGSMTGDGAIVWLRGSVLLDRPPGAGRPFTLETSDMQVRSHEQYAETAAPVRMSNEGGVVTAVGMHAWLKENHVRLLSQVRGEYAPL